MFIWPSDKGEISPRGHGKKSHSALRSYQQNKSSSWWGTSEIARHLFHYLNHMKIDEDGVKKESINF